MKRIKTLTNQLNIRNLVMLTIAGFINAFGVTMFLSPVKLFDSGISGTSMLLSQLTSGTVSLSVFLLLLNVPLFLFGLKRQGITFTIYSLYAVAIYSLGAWLICDILPVDVSTASPFGGTDLLLCAIFGGLISGIGSGLTIRNGGAIDGIEVMAVIFAKKIGITVGNFVMIYNVALYLLAGISCQNWILPLYSIITYYVGQNAVDFIVEGLDRSKGVMIITASGDEVSAALMDAFETGTTKLAAKGGYSDADRTMIYFVVNRFQIAKMKNIVHAIDPYAFLTIQEVADVFKNNSAASQIPAEKEA